MEKKITELLARLAVVEAEMAHPTTAMDQKRYRALTQEHSYLSSVEQTWKQLETARRRLDENRAMLKDEKDTEFAAVLREDIASLEARIPALDSQLTSLLIPPDPNDSRNTMIELRAGTGGEEAALFVGDCVRMYQLFADHQGWRCEVLSSTPSDLGGFREYIMVVSGPNVYRFLRHEAGTHRVQRVPATEAQGRIHTSAITVAVLLEPDEDEAIAISEKDLRVDTYRSSGAGGQHVNVTDSAVRLTHLPTGTVVCCSDERSQHKNKAKATRVLQARLAELEQEKKAKEMATTRSTQVGSGDRSERIRTYNFPQNRITDHRINLTRHNLDRVMNGDLDDIVLALVADFHQRKLE
jgi:peptide chain release factor 1